MNSFKTLWYIQVDSVRINGDDMLGVLEAMEHDKKYVRIIRSIYPDSTTNKRELCFITGNVQV